MWLGEVSRGIQVYLAENKKVGDLGDLRSRWLGEVSRGIQEGVSEDGGEHGGDGGWRMEDGGGGWILEEI